MPSFESRYDVFADITSRNSEVEDADGSMTPVIRNLGEISLYYDFRSYRIAMKNQRAQNFDKSFFTFRDSFHLEEENYIIHLRTDVG